MFCLGQSTLGFRGRGVLRIELGPSPKRFLELQIAPDSSVTWGQGQLSDVGRIHPAGRADVEHYRRDPQGFEKVLEKMKTKTPSNVESMCFFWKNKSPLHRAPDETDWRVFQSENDRVKQRSETIAFAAGWRSQPFRQNLLVLGTSDILL